ncbi:MAG: hypothetical protein WC785_09410 [Tatlockia sp.]|jgi:hypothetical protein
MENWVENWNTFFKNQDKMVRQIIRKSDQLVYHLQSVFKLTDKLFIPHELKYKEHRFKLILNGVAEEKINMLTEFFLANSCKIASNANGWAVTISYANLSSVLDAVKNYNKPEQRIQLPI